MYYPHKKTLQPNLNSLPMQELVVNLDERNEEFISGGNHLTRPIFIFANLSQQDKPGYRFPMDGPGRGGTQ